MPIRSPRTHEQRKRLLLIGLAAAGLTLPSQPQKSLAAPLPLASSEGMALLSTSEARADYGDLAQAFLTQANLAYCGVASSVMVLNSLALPAPETPGYGSYRFWTQDNIWSGTDPKAVISASQVQKRGMTLSQLAALLKAHGLTVEAIHGTDLTLERFRQHLEENLRDGSDRLLMNYNRRFLGQLGGGHISPIAAYHRRSDQVLILDVARYRYPSVWVPLTDLWQAIRSIDPDSGQSRGIVRITR